MAGRKRPPQVQRPTGRQRVWEWCKDLLIILLACSALYLTWQTPLVSQIRDMVAEPVPSAAPVSLSGEEAVAPYLMAVRGELGLYGAGYDPSTVDRVFQRFSPFLGEALSTAGTAESASQRQWRSLLESPGFYCAFQGELPLAVLSAWLGEGGDLTGKAQALVVGWDGFAVWLAWRDGESYYRAPTQVVYAGRLDAALGEFTPNGAAYAYALAASDSTYAALDGDVLTLAAAPQPQVYAASSPDFVGDQEALEALLDMLGFQSGVGSAYEAAGDLAINESGDRLRVNAAGRVSFFAGDEGRYPVPDLEGVSQPQDAALAAWELLNRAASPWKGELSYVLTGVEETSRGWKVTFEERLGGVPVLTGESGWCARFLIEGGRIYEFSLTLRSCSPTGAASLVTTERLAAAAMESLPGGGRRLLLCYSDDHAATLTAGWVAAN